MIDILIYNHPKKELQWYLLKFLQYYINNNEYFLAHFFLPSATQWKNSAGNYKTELKGIVFSTTLEQAGDSSHKLYQILSKNHN